DAGLSRRDSDWGNDRCESRFRLPPNSPRRRTPKPAIVARTQSNRPTCPTWLTCPTRPSRIQVEEAVEARRDGGRGGFGKGHARPRRPRRPEELHGQIDDALADFLVD